VGLFKRKKQVAPPVDDEAAGTPEEELAAVFAAVSAVSEPGTQSEELAAVFAAAVAAFEAEAYASKLRIRKIGRAAGVKPAWGAAGLNEAIDTRRM
jgi:hypothetical protein